MCTVKWGRKDSYNTHEECTHTVKHTQTHSRACITSRSTSQNKMEGDKEQQRGIRRRKVVETEAKEKKKEARDVVKESMMGQREDM